MVDPISIACLAALADVTKATMEAAVGGIVGGRADSVFCRLMLATTDHFLKNARLPENHDLVIGVMSAHQRSIQYVAETICGQARDLRERIIAEKILARAKQEAKAEVVTDISRSLMPLLTPLVAGPGHDEAGVRRDRMIAAARDRLIAWIEAEVGETLPEHFRRLFADPAPDGRAPWQDIFRLYVAEAIKTNLHFESVFLAGNVSEIVGRTITTETLVIGLEKGLETLRAQLGIVAADVKLALATQEVQARQIKRIAEQTERILKVFGGTPLAAEARKASVENRAFVLLARKINLEVDDETQALNELNRAVEELLEIKESAEGGPNLDALVDRALRRIAERSLRGEFDSAAAEAASAFAAWERREIERCESEQQSGLTLIKANIQQQLLRRDSVSAAGWIERRLALECRHADAASFMAEIEVWYAAVSSAA
jgi:hypothetical protein